MQLIFRSSDNDSCCGLGVLFSYFLNGFFKALYLKTRQNLTFTNMSITQMVWP